MSLNNKTYIGRRVEIGTTIVQVEGNYNYLLNPRNDLINHSPDGFEWGYGGSGPSQLALAILADHLQDDLEAKALYQQFKWKTVSNWKESTFSISSDQIDEILEGIREENDNRTKMQ